jgi:hypothetical protein
VLPLYECATESVADLIAAESVVDPAVAKGGVDPTAAERLHSVADPAVASAASTETSWLYVHI